MLEALSATIIHLISQSGYLGILILMIFNSGGIPIPSEITLPFAGFLAHGGSLSLPIIIIVAVIGDLIGSLIAYSIGFFLEERLILNLIKKYGKIILLTPEDYSKATGWMKSYGAPVVFVGKLLPGVKSFIALAAGVSEIKIHKFIIGNILAALVYVSAVTYFGFYLGSKWNVVGGYFRKFELVIVLVLVLAILFYVNHKLKIVKLPKLQ